MDKASVTRLVSLIVGLLAYFSINIPADVSEEVVAIVVGVIALWTAWKNNNITKESQESQKYLDELKEQKKQGKKLHSLTKVH